MGERREALLQLLRDTLSRVDQAPASDTTTERLAHCAHALLADPAVSRLLSAQQPTFAEEAKKANRFLDAIIENIPDMIFVKDASRLAFERFNRAGEELLGVPRTAMLGKTDYDFFPEEQAEFFQLKDRNTLSERRLLEIPEEPIQTARGLRWLHTKKVPIVDEHGEPQYLLGIPRDITEQKAAAAALLATKEALEAANRELEAFSYSVAHDLRAPLRSVDGFAQALIEDYGDKLDGEARGYLDCVRDSAQHMAKLIDDLLTLSRMTRSEMKRERVDLSRLAQTCWDRIRRSSPTRRVELVIAPGLLADCDPRLLSVVLDNLLSNAWKFTTKRDDARVELGSICEGAQTTYFVRDNGAGFDMAFVGKLFGVFQRLHDAGSFDGTGIGLAIVARVVGRHGGRAWAEGAVDQGATFYFTLESAAAAELRTAHQDDVENTRGKEQAIS